MGTTKRILLIGEWYKPLIPWFLEDKAPTGVPAVYNLYKYLGDSDRYQFHSIIFNREVNRKKVFPNGSILELRKFYFPNYYLWKFLVFFRLIFVCQRLLNNSRVDLLYGLSTFSTIAALLGKWNKILSVGRIYGTILTKEVKTKNYFRLYTRFFFDVLAIKLPADIIICTQDGTQYDQVVQFFNKTKKVYLFYNGMEKSLREKLLSFPSKKQLKEPLQLCCIARLEYYKRHDMAIKIINLLVHHHKVNVCLNIVGSGSKLTDLQQMVVKYRLKPHVNFIQEMPHKEIPGFLLSQDAALFLYEGGSLGNILWEGALAGRLILTIDNAGTGDIFKDGINCLIAADDEKFVEIMAAKINDHINKDLSRITSNSRELVSGLISDWQTRFEREFQFIFQESKLAEGDGK